MDKLILFDVDRTLIKKMNISREHWTRSFEKIYGVRVSVEDLNTYFSTTHGYTFKGTVENFLKHHGVAEEVIRERFGKFTKVLVRFYLENLKKAEVEAVDGAGELLEELKKKGVMLGLVTGNAEKIGWGKVEKVGLKKYFSFGGFGEEDVDRVKLVESAIEKARGRGFRFEKGEVWVVGDTPKDIEAGRGVKGVRTIGVASGIYSEKELREAGADFVLDGLWEKEKFLGIVFDRKN